MATEIEHLRFWELSGQGSSWAKKGVRTYVASESSAESEVMALWQQPWSGVHGLTCTRVRVIYHPNNILGVVMLRAHYETPGWGRIYRREANKARLITQSIIQLTTKRVLEPKVQGKDSKIIEGPDPDLDGVIWRVVDGDNRVGKFSTKFRLETAYYADRLNLPEVMSIEDHVNATAFVLVGFGVIKPESLLCTGILTRRSIGDPLADMDYLFNWSGPDENWNQKVKSAPGVWIAEETPVFDKNGQQVAGTPETAIVWKPGKKRVYNASKETWSLVDADPEVRRMYPTANFTKYMVGLQEW